MHDTLNQATPHARSSAPLDVLWTSALGRDDGDAYDRFVDEAEGGNFAQARAWAPVARAGRPLRVRYFLARTPEDGRVIGAAMVLRARAGPLPLPAAIVERGPVCGRVEDLPRVLAALVRASRRHGVARLTVMPYWAGDRAPRAEDALASCGFKDVQEWTGAHVSTLRLDLTKTDEQICAGKEGGNLRTSIRRAEKAGAIARLGTPADMPIFERLYGEVMGAQGRKSKPPEWFSALAGVARDGTRGNLFVCEHEGEPMGTAFVTRHGNTATLTYAATTSASRPFSKLVPPLMAAIRWAREHGCTIFDLGGVPMEGDPDEKRRDIAAFKFHFARERVGLAHEHARWF